MRNRLASLLIPPLLAITAACGDSPAPQAPPPAQPLPPPPPPPQKTLAPTDVPPQPTVLTGLSREDFNHRAADMALPLLWAEDKDGNGALDPSELVLVWGIWPNAKITHFVKDGAFTPHFMVLYNALKARGANAADAREIAVRKELAQARPTLVRTDLKNATEADKTFVQHVESIAQKIEVVYQKQRGTYAFRERLKKDDRPSKMLFFRNQSPRCEAPLTEHDPACDAVDGDDKNAKLSGMYPSGLLREEKFCEELAKNKDKSLTNPFTVVQYATAPVSDGHHNDQRPVKSVPYNVEYKDEMNAIADELEAAAKDETDPNEAALKAYLQADAQSFRTNEWVSADEAWAKMNADNSKFYVRIAPDETYREPCNTKALFHVSFGVINQKSKKWQAKFTPLKDSMEKLFSDLAGAPYKPRAVKFKLPDFVDIALNAGDSRTPFDAVIGQSLPNFGKVEMEGRGRTVAMPNFYTDASSIREIESQAKSLFCDDTMTSYTRDTEPLLMSTVLHEAGHNLGPYNSYKVNGKSDREIFGGPLASIFEEAKAESGSLFLIGWLAEKKELTQDEANRAILADLLWGFSQISAGLYDNSKQPKTYAQLEAIQVGFLMKEGALRWNADKTAANAIDKGCFAVDFPKLPAAFKNLMKEILGAKARGDKKKAESLIKEYVDVTGDKKVTLDTITQRMNRVPKATFLYSIDL